jgi:predicted aspartyl protease
MSELDMGVFYTDAIFVNVKDETRAVEVKGMLVDTGAESSWVPRKLLDSIGVERRKKDRAFQMANGAIITRGVGYALIRSGEYETVDEVVFAEEGDLPILGARTLEGFNARVDPTNKKLVAAGPIPAANAIAMEADSKKVYLAPGNLRFE